MIIQKRFPLNLSLAFVICLTVNNVLSKRSPPNDNEIGIHIFQAKPIDKNQMELMSNYHSPLPHTYIAPHELPKAFSWGNVNGVSFLTKSLNQHLEQYCGSCFAHAAASALGDRIKIARGYSNSDRALMAIKKTEAETEINLSVQFVLNCGYNYTLSCHGGSTSRAYAFIQEYGVWPYETCSPYLACSSNSEEGFCPFIDTSCSPINVCKTCMPGSAGCTALTNFPNASIAEYGVYRYDDYINNNLDPNRSMNENVNDVEMNIGKWMHLRPNIIHAIMAEIFARGPVKASVDAIPLINYTGGILWDAPQYHSTMHHHGVSIVGWGYDNTLDRQFWIVRNSWGQYWGELGYFRIELGKNLLMIESNIAWATPGTFTTFNLPCNVANGSDCGISTTTTTTTATAKNSIITQAPTSASYTYEDPSHDIESIRRRLKAYQDA